MISGFFGSLPVWGVFIFLSAILIISAEAGYRIGRRALNVRHEKKTADIGTLVGSALGMLALLLGFTFAMSAQRFDDRRQLVVKESNAIGTAYLRSMTMPEPTRTEAKNLFRRYVDVRLELVANVGDTEKANALLAETDEIQGKLWAGATSVAATGQNPVFTSIYLQALNDVIDVHAERLAAVRARVPGSIFIVTLVVSMLAILLTGYSAGLGENRNAMATTLAALLIALVMTLIVDLHRPHEGSITISQQSMTDLRDWLNK